MAALQQNRTEGQLPPKFAVGLQIVIVGDPADGGLLHRLQEALQTQGAHVWGLNWQRVAEASEAWLDAVVFIADETLEALLAETSFDDFVGQLKGQKIDPFWIWEGRRRELGGRVKARLYPKLAQVVLDRDASSEEIEKIVTLIIAPVVAAKIKKAGKTKKAAAKKTNPRARKSTSTGVPPVSSSSFSDVRTIGEFFNWPTVKSGLNDSDRKAFRLGAMLAKYIVPTELDGWAVFCGYLLTAPLDGNHAETAMTKAIWYSYATTGGEAVALNLVDFWAALKLSHRRAELEREAADERQVDDAFMSAELRRVIEKSMAVSKGNPRHFYTRHLLACMIADPNEGGDHSVHHGLNSLGVDPSRVRSMYRRWMASYRRSDDPEVLDKLLGKTSARETVMWPKNWRPERVGGDEPKGNEGGEPSLDERRVENTRQFLEVLQERASILEELMDDPSQDQAEIISELITTRNEIGQIMLELAVPQSETSEGEQPAAVRWLEHVARLDPGSVHFEDNRKVKDALGVEDYARRFARVIALRATELPLSIGLFGQWGSGKTYFMKLLQQEIKELPSSAPGEWCQEVAAIRFNAWHYLDTNLWASLVTEIFDQMLEHLAGPNRDEAERLETAKKLMKQIEKGKGAVSEMKVEIAAIEQEKQRATDEIAAEEQRLEIVAKEVDKTGRAMAVRLDFVGLAMKEILSSKESQQALKTLHLEKAVGSWKQLHARFVDLHSLGGRVRALGSVVGSGWWGVWSLVALLILLWAGPMLIGLASAHLLHDGGSVDSVKMAVGSISGALISIAGWLGAQVTRLKKLFGQVDKIEKAARKARAQNETSKTMTRLRARAASLAKEQEEAAEKLKAARAKVRKLEEDLREIRPERRLYRFIEERAAAKDYRQHLGLVSLVRRDFRALSDLFRAQKDGVSEWKKLPGGGERSIDRVVLYVDDLDRCQPQRVVEVLEAVHLLLDFPLFVAVVAVDSRWVKQSLRTHYARLLGGAEETRRVSSRGSHNGDAPAADARPAREEERQATPLDYLEKIFHIPFHLPAMTNDGYLGLMKSLAGEIPTKSAAASATGTRKEASMNEPLMPKDTGEDSRHERGAQENEPPAGENQTEAVEDVEEESIPRGGAQSQSLGFVELEEWDLQGLNLFKDLIHTPRGAKRFINTYRLVRAGVASDADWNRFRANDGGEAECYVAMFLLAAAAGQPSMAREWFQVVRDADPGALVVFDGKPGDWPEGWSEFKKVFDAIWVEGRQKITQELYVKWLDRVERFAF